MPVRIYSKFGFSPIPGCVAWDHKGYVISVSTIARPPELLVWRADDSRNSGAQENVFSCYPTAEGVKKAVEFINRKVKRDEKNEQTS